MYFIIIAGVIVMLIVEGYGMRYGMWNMEYATRGKRSNKRAGGKTLST